MGALSPKAVDIKSVIILSLMVKLSPLDGGADMNVQTTSRRMELVTRGAIAGEVDEHLQRARNLVRAILMASVEITRDERDSNMLTELSLIVGGELDAIERILSPVGEAT
jgi:hypothetical protein